MSLQRSAARRASLRRAALFQIEGLERRLLLSSAIAAFGAQQAFSTGANPRSVAVADVNTDGRLDLLVANSVGNTVSVLLGNANGTYQAQQTYAVGSTPFSIAAADVNLDGKLDLITANNGGNNVSVLLGNGNGTFQSQKTFGAGTNARFVAVADVNGDGKPDLITANYNASGSGTVSVLLGNGNGTFAGQQTFSVGTKPSSIAVADLNGDGKLDLAAVNKGSNNVSILLGNGNGTFQAQQLFSVGAAPFFVAAGDLNQDGKLDLVTADESSNAVSVLLGNGNGTFQTHQTYATGTIPASVAISDINGDGKPDVVAANYSSNSVSVLLGNGNGTLQPQKTFATGTNPFGVAVADVNRDGGQDLLVANEGDNNVGALLIDVPPTVLSINRAVPSGPTTSATSVNYTVTFSKPVSGVDPTDFNLTLNGVTATTPVGVSGSGAVYTVTVSGISGNGTVGLNLVADGSNIKDAAGNALQVVTYQPQQTFAGDSRPVYSIVAADVNGDGRPDLIVANRSNPGTVGILLGNGDGTFQAQQTFATAAGSYPTCIAVADANGDGRPDLLVANQNATVSVLLGNGNGTFQAQQTFADASSPTAFTEFITAADVNGDGKPDLLVPDASNGNFSVLLGNGNGTFGTPATFATENGPLSLAVLDVNGDGKLDVAVASDGAFGVDILLGNGNGTFQARRSFTTGSLPFSVALSDVNGDGKPDLIVANSQAGYNAGVLLGNGDGTFQAQQTFKTGSSPRFIAVADMNGDGSPDLLLANYYSNTVTLLLGNGNGTFEPQQVLSTGVHPRCVAVADFNGDGSPDLIVGNKASHNIGVLLANPTGQFAGQLYTIAPPAETITGTPANDTTTLVADTDGANIDWSLGTNVGHISIIDPSGLTINGNNGIDSIVLDHSDGNPLPNTIHLNGTFFVSNLTGSNPFSNTTLDIGRSVVYLSYSNMPDPLGAIEGYLKNGFNNGAWNGTPAATTGVICSIPAAQNAAQTTAIGYADSADGLIAGQPPNTIELKYTLYGDTTLTGAVGFNDFTRLTQHYNQTTGGTWDTGDFNYDGSVNFGDFTLMTRTYNTSIGNQAIPVAASASSVSSDSIAAAPASSARNDSATVVTSSSRGAKPVTPNGRPAPPHHHRAAKLRRKRFKGSS